MERDEVVRISGAAHFGGVDFTDVRKILTEYCLEHDKKSKEIEVFIETIIRSGMATPILKEALEWYEKKYGIIKIESAPDQWGNRELISIK